MGSQRTSISTILVRPLGAALTSRADGQAAMRAFCNATDLTPEILADAEARVSPAQFCVAWAEAIHLTRDASLALTIAEATPPGAFGVVEYVCRSAPTLRVALEQWIRYLGILDDAVEVALVDEGSATALRVVLESEAPAPASHELCFALVVRHARTMLGAGLTASVASAVSFTHRVSAATAARHRAFFGAPVTFGAKATEIVFPRERMEARLTTADPNLLAILLPTAEEKRGRKATHLPSTDQVRRALRTALTSDDAQLEGVARRLGMTGRSLQRRLKDEGTAFQTVRDEMRRELADRYVGQGMSFSEISFLLGFSEPSAFFRAFKRWFGLTPFERRESLNQGLT